MRAIAGMARSYRSVPDACSNEKARQSAGFFMGEAYCWYCWV